MIASYVAGYWPIRPSSEIGQQQRREQRHQRVVGERRGVVRHLVVVERPRGSHDHPGRPPHRARPVSATSWAAARSTPGCLPDRKAAEPHTGAGGWAPASPAPAATLAPPGRIPPSSPAGALERLLDDRPSDRSRRAARRVRRLRDLRTRPRRRPPCVLRAVRAPAPRAGVRRDRDHRRRRQHHDRCATSASCRQVFDEQKLRALPGDLALGHVRYSTTGSSAWENAQPIYRSDDRELALAHNGNLTNAVELHAELRERDVAVPLDLRLGDHRRAALHPPGRADRGRRRRRAAAPARRLLDRRDDARQARRVPRPARPAPARARDARRPLLRRERVVRARHHRREIPARGRAGRGADDRRRRDLDARWRSKAPAAPSASSSTSTSRAPTRSWAAPCCRARAAGWARSSRARRRSTPTS